MSAGLTSCPPGIVRRLRPLVAAMIALVAGACASTSVTRQIFLPDPPKLTESAPQGQREHQRVLAAYGGEYEDPKLQAMLSRMVNRLVAASDRPDLSYKVTILNSPSVNAFALPTGQLYVTRGLLGLANDSSELASVVSHEIAHVVAHHADRREEEARRAELVNNVVKDVLSDPEDGALALARAKLALASFSRAQEFEADGIGVGIAQRSGYDPYGAARFLTAMGRNADFRAGGRSRDDRSLDFLSSHPATPERVKSARTSARQLAAPGTGTRDKATYLTAIDGLVYGEDPIDGFVRGRRFLHPKLGFTFTAPEGFSLDNTAQAVLGLKEPGGSEALRLDVVKVPPEQTLVEYLNSGWIEHIEAGSVEELSINGFPAATATATGDQWTFRLYAIRFGSEIYRFIFAAKTRTEASEHAFREAVGTFRRLSLAEIRSAKPLRIKVVRAAAGDTVEQVASRMALIDRQVDRFRVMNGLDANDEVKPGDFLKIIVE